VPLKQSGYLTPYANYWKRMLKSTSAHTHKWKSAKSSNTVIQHDAEFNTVASKGNQQETGSETNFGTVA